MNIRGNLSSFGLLLYRLKKYWTSESKKNSMKPNIPLWNNAISYIESRFGPGIACYFGISRWIFMVNLLLTIIWTGLIVVPGILVQDFQLMTANGIGFDKFIFGEGGYSTSFFFQGIYPTVIGPYKLNLAYLLVSCLFIIITLCGILYRLRSRLLSPSDLSGKLTEDKSRAFSSAAFSSWDFTIDNAQRKKNHQYAISTMFLTLITETEMNEEKGQLKVKQMVFLLLRRFIINIIILGLFGGSGVLIYLSILNEQNIHNISSTTNTDPITVFTGTISTIPSVTVIAILDMIMHPIFHFLGKLEKYYDKKIEAKLLLIRSYVFKLAWMYLIFLSLWKDITNQQREGKLFCWETLVGQKFYQLVLIDIITSCLLGSILPGVMFIITRRSQRFNVPSEILDLIKRQAILWFGAIYSPILPLYSLIGSFMLFYIKKWTLLTFTEPPRRIYSTYKLESYFLTFMMLTLVAITGPIAYVLSSMKPSCGPFRNLNYAYEIIPKLISASSDQSFISFWNFVGSIGFFLPLFLILS